VGTTPVDEREELLAQDVSGGHLVPRFARLVNAWLKRTGGKFDDARLPVAIICEATARV
jgi:hypothetical protein